LSDSSTPWHIGRQDAEQQERPAREEVALNVGDEPIERDTEQQAEADQSQVRPGGGPAV